MRTLASAADREAIVKRVSALTPSDRGLWGRMTVDQMVCHLCDSYKIVLGEKKASPATEYSWRRTIKWIALRVPVRWPKGTPTRPEVEQGVGGTRPSEFGADRAELLATLARFCGGGIDVAIPHPIFGRMSASEWLRWGFLHADHHLRQFGR